MKKLGQLLQDALSVDIPAELATLIITTSNTKRLQETFQQASRRLLDAHHASRQRPHSVLANQERIRNKALVDLVRARIAATGCRKPAVGKMLALMDTETPKNVIEIRKAA
jgi:hypothetical protein